MVIEKITRVHNPRPSLRRKSRKRKARRRNPIPQLVTLGVINPRPRRAAASKGDSSMARKTRKRRNRRATVKRRRRNPSYKAHTVHRRRHTRRHASRRRRRNPMVSHGSGAAMAKSVAGGLLGVTLTKMASGFLSGMLPGMASSPIMKAVISGVAAFGIGKLVGGIDRDFGAAAAFGGYMQAGSDALNAVAPSLGSQFGLRGLGAFMPSRFAVPENPIMRGLPAPAPADVNGSFVRRTF